MSALTPPSATGLKITPKPRKRGRRAAAVLAATALAAWPLTLSFASPAPNPTSPGSLKGWAFDACRAPSASTMDAWLKDKTNPYRGIGIYISGALRACSQPNLTAAWVSHVQHTGWHLLPITVGPQASCTGFSQVISDKPANTYAAARRQAAAQADDAVANARALGIPQGSTLFYDMEHWHTGYNNCDASTLWFLSAWTNRLHAYGYAGGTYVSGLSGARLLNAMANNTPSGFVLPDQIWTAEWNREENTDSDYLDADNWSNHQRAHQYRGGHDATNTGITLNIDSNFVDLAPVVPIPAVVPDSAIGAVPAPKPSPKPTPKPSPKPTPKPSPKPSSQPTPSAKPTPTKTATPKPTPRPTPSAIPTATKTPSKTPTKTPSKTPTNASSAVPTKKPSTTKATPKPTKTATAHPTKRPTAAPTTKSPKPAPKPKPTKKPAPRLTHPTTKPQRVVDSTPKHDTASGIKAPTKPEPKALAPVKADRVPAMTAPAPAHTAPRKAAPPSAPTAAPTRTAPQVAEAQAVPLQPTLPVTLPAATNEPSLIAKILEFAQNAMVAIGHALAAAAAWAARGFASMLGW